MNTLNFLDANVWPALLWNRRSFSEQAVSWFERASDEQFFFCRFTQITILRLLTAERVMERKRSPWRKFGMCGTECGHMIASNFSLSRMIFEREFRLHSRSHSPSPKVWPDAYLLALAAVAGLQLVTSVEQSSLSVCRYWNCDIEQGHQWKARLTQSYTEGYWGKVTQIATW